MMKKLTGNKVKLLNLVHIIAAGLWLGGASSNALILMKSNALSSHSPEYEFSTMLIHSIDWTIVIPSSMVLLFTGLLYGLFTNWGFAKHRWVLSKWILALIVIATSIAFFPSGGVLFCILQLTMILALFILSVFKPWKAKRLINKNAT